MESLCPPCYDGQSFKSIQTSFPLLAEEANAVFNEIEVNGLVNP
jgi:hypothetical protein